jgi:dihydroflavonol-4-reductase
MIRFIALFDPTVRLVVPGLGKVTRASAEKARTMLGWSGRTMREMVLDAARSMSQRKAA